MNVGTVGPVLAADIGNTHTAIGLVADAEVLDEWRVATDDRRSADEWLVLLRGLLGERLSRIRGIAVCSTVPSVLHEWRDLVARHFAQLPRVIVEPGVRTGIPVRTDNPREVGADRILNALAAATDVGPPAIVVDFGGTATTFDVVDPHGQYVGGAISPGLELSLDALGRRGAQLRKVELARPRTVVARNTVEAIQSGMVFGVASQVEGLVSRMIAELDVPADRVHVIATGHLASLVVDECRCFTHRLPGLTLRGLELAFLRNATR